jgi:hypothetical protein
MKSLLCWLSNSPRLLPFLALIPVLSDLLAREERRKGVGSLPGAASGRLGEGKW